MAEELELARLLMADNSEMVLTTRHVYQRKDSGWRGETSVAIPRGAITSIKIEWHRNLGFIAAGVIVLAIAAALYFITFPFPVPAFAAPVGAVFGVALMLLCLIKSKSIHIAAPTVTVGGEPDDYEQAESFCDLLLNDVRELPEPAKKNETATTPKDESPDSKWQL
jgi:hypothetical protein